VRFSTVAWNVDLNRVETFGTAETPRIEVARTMHMAIAIPIFVEPVRVRDHLFADGGIVDIFPVRPVLASHPDVVIGVNAYLPENFAGEDVTGWRSRSFAVLRASSQLRWSGMVALAREQALLVKDKLTLLHPVPYEEVRGTRFYETFFDRSRWAKFMRDGREAARNAFS
jgi:NTE family protein